MSNITFTLVSTEDGGEFVTLYHGGQAHGPADASHPNFTKIKDACLASLKDDSVVPEDVVPLFDVAETVRQGFQRLSERVTVRDGQILVDGDPVNSILTDQILAFVDEGEGFGPLVNFYEKLLTNPYPEVRETLYGWIAGQTEGGVVTITSDGDLVGYKGVWYDLDNRYKPSHANSVECLVTSADGETQTFGPGTYTVQGVGDTVEMPRAEVSGVSHQCGVGLHIGTWDYAKSFGPHTLKVRFNPRDVVSAPDANSSWKVRAIRYTILEVIENGQPHDSVLYRDVDEDSGLDLGFEENAGALAVGDRVRDDDGDEGVVVNDGFGDLAIRYDDSEAYGDLAYIDDANPEDGLAEYDGSPVTFQRIHGRGGPTSEEAKGNGRNPAQDDKGRFSNGRPGSQRGPNGRFVG